MRNAWLVVFLVGGIACGGGGGKAKPQPPPPVTNNATDQVADKEAPPPAAKPAAHEWKVEMIAGGKTVQGVLFDKKTKDPLIGATIILTSPALQGTQAAITDEKGVFSVGSLPPGKYMLAVYYMDITAEKTDIDVTDKKTAKVTGFVDVLEQQGQVITIGEAPRPQFKSALEALKVGAVGDAVLLGKEELAKKASSKLHAMMAMSRYAFAIEVFRLDAFSNMGGEDEKKKKSVGKTFKTAVENFQKELVLIDEHLREAAKDKSFSFELCVACMASDDGYLTIVRPGGLDIERDRNNKELPEKDKRRRPTYRFDYGDLHWARAMTQYHLAATNILLAYDWNWIDRLIAQGDAGKNMPKKITIKLAEPARIAKAREAILEGLVSSEAARTAFLAETDDDREWVPNPKQKNYASPLPVDDKLYGTWQDVITDVRALVASEAGISFEALWALFGSEHPAPKGFIDFGAMLKSPKAITFELGMIDRMEAEQNAGKRAKLEQTFLKGMIGNGFKATMKPSPLTDRLIQLRKDFGHAEEQFEDKLKYVLWLN